MAKLYNKLPSIEIKGWEQAVWNGYGQISKELQRSISGKQRFVLTIECYPGVRIEEIVTGLQEHLNPVKVVYVEKAVKDQERIDNMIERCLTDDRVFGYMAPFDIVDFYDSKKLAQIQAEIASLNEGVILVIGTGASLVSNADALIYADMARWEIQLRYRSHEFGNWLADNHSEDILRKYKRGYFVEWRAADRMKRAILPQADYYLDTNAKDAPKMLSKDALFDAMKQTVNRPFRLVPYFDPGVWGGKWLEDKIDLEKREHPYAWGFDGVPEENSVYLVVGSTRVEVPAINLVFFENKNLLGEKVFARFGAEFPIRFDFLDTIGGQNLSLQVHPLTDYIRETFGMSYTQDESYYMLDTVPGAVVYLGLKDGIRPEDMMMDLERAQAGDYSFPAEKYVNLFPAKKHDHFLIPAGTVHCSGAGGMVLEISATPYIFTFKLWDWDRLGLDGKPRPVHLQHGRKNIQWDRTTDWVERNLVNPVVKIGEGEGWVEERTGLHELEFIETRRHWFTAKVNHHTEGGVQMLNLVEGEEAVVESPSGAFEPFIIRYAETFIVPASVGAYTIKPTERSQGTRLGTIKAYVRS
ncbi:class I mannose-6-phosphate isomerase [Paenibacillus cremeus]|uniref:Mannose-6-phosphate isomerase n=1 Tax=Paenibacillus cremeus TaxID=2163881 RepID=A0A559K785_9BACL|nr:class I mannose-6-phosphate isomerase [Paenibacillus cremeus]TVY07991.1 mannose-6-phosphate isomerase [Paenibacillus cremeus]